ncbi:unnamed protein product [Macrosiphum euphorbiae]|uniref:Zinc finger PHD-type domain-containing protein n=1 Tax=Macrosiphum euphorbiae TaxID=13131 RepID=A0AAV0XH63_9HEMI|nr:unnamed protein product [Macrosiphum euphorbiae]
MQIKNRKNLKKKKNLRKNRKRREEIKKEKCLKVAKKLPKKQKQEPRKSKITKTFKPVLSISMESEDDTTCLYCKEPYTLSKSGEPWIKCCGCAEWAHELCADSENTIAYICDFCR